MGAPSAATAVGVAAVSELSTAQTAPSRHPPTSAIASTIQTAHDAARDARHLHAIWAWASPRVCGEPTADSPDRIPLAPTAGGATRKVQYRCQRQSAVAADVAMPTSAGLPHSGRGDGGLGAEACEVSLSVSTLPKTLCGRCSIVG